MTWILTVIFIVQGVLLTLFFGFPPKYAPRDKVLAYNLKVLGVALVVTVFVLLQLNVQTSGDLQTVMYWVFGTINGLVAFNVSLLAGWVLRRVWFFRPSKYRRAEAKR